MASRISSGIVRADCDYMILPEPMKWQETEDWVWGNDLTMFLESGINAIGYKDKFFRRFAIPALQAYTYYKDTGNPHRLQLAISVVDKMADSEWRTAMKIWLERQLPRNTK